MQNGWTLLARIAFGVVAPSHAGEVMFRVRDGMQLAAPSRDYGWWPIVEVVIDDCYHLSELAAELRDRECLVLDIGAHVGSFTVAFATAVPKSRFIAFEPSTERVGYLRRNVVLNALDQRVTVVQSAVASRADRRMLIVSKISDDAPETTEADCELVDLVSFGGLMDSFDGPIDLLKMDCEGSEYDIVASASRAMLRRIERLVVEYHPAPAEQVALLFSTLAEAGLVERWRQDTEPGQLGVVYFGREID